MKDTKDAILKMNGIEKKDNKAEENKTIICSRCGTVNSPGSEFCFDCHLGLKLESVMDYEKTSKETLKNIDDSRKMEAILEVLIKRIEQLEKEKY